jgi:hypothetical protein
VPGILEHGAVDDHFVAMFEVKHQGHGKPRRQTLEEN